MKFFMTPICVVLSVVLAACGGGGGSGTSGTSGGGSGNNLLAASVNATDSASGANATAAVSAGAAASIALASGDKIDASDDIFYAKRFAVSVANTNGLPVVGARISLKVTYPAFYKGGIGRDDKFKVLTRTEFRCAGEDVNNDDILNVGEDKNGNGLLDVGEDLNNDGILNVGEDTNGNGVLDPAKALVTAVVEGSNLTDTNGNVKILVRWPKRHASWVEYRLNTTVTVTGTEGKSAFDFRTSYAAGDDEVASTPFLRSPYGVSAGCSNTN